MRNTILIDAVRNFIKINKPAVLVGNGINRYADPYAWDDLLKDLLKHDELKDDICVQKRISALFDEDGRVKNGISCTEVYDLINSAYRDAVFYTDDEKESENEEPTSLQLYVKNCLPEKNFSRSKFKHIAKFIKIAKKERLPVMTTNFDEHLETFLKCPTTKVIDANVVKNKSIKHFAYPWNQYSIEKGSQQLEDSKDGFAIWHIHGCVKDARSIQMGTNQYMRIARHAMSLMTREKDNSGNTADLTLYKNDEKWYGSNTWLELIFHKNLLLMGVGLKKDEFCLRWLLMERMKYLKKRFSETNEDKFKKWMTSVYITCANTLSVEERIFLETCGFEVIELSSYKEVYEDLWENWSEK